MRAVLVATVNNDLVRPWREASEKKVALAVGSLGVALTHTRTHTEQGARPGVLGCALGLGIISWLNKVTRLL